MKEDKSDFVQRVCDLIGLDDYFKPFEKLTIQDLRELATVIRESKAIDH